MIVMGRVQVTSMAAACLFSLNFRFHTVFLKTRYKLLLSFAATKLGLSLTPKIFITSVLEIEPKILNFRVIFYFFYLAH